jgi:hypothetical protein
MSRFFPPPSSSFAILLQKRMIEREAFFFSHATLGVLQNFSDAKENKTKCASTTQTNGNENKKIYKKNSEGEKGRKLFLYTKEEVQQHKRG